MSEFRRLYQWYFPNWLYQNRVEESNTKNSRCSEIEKEDTVKGYERQWSNMFKGINSELDIPDSTIKDSVNEMNIKVIDMKKQKKNRNSNSKSSSKFEIKRWIHLEIIQNMSIFKANES